MQFRFGEYFRTLLPVLILFTGLCFLYIGVIPPFEGPDGPEHAAYLAWLADGNGFPPQGKAAWETPVRQEAGQPPLYYLIAAVPLRLLRGHEPLAVYRPNPHFPSDAPGTVPDNKNVAIYYPTDSLQGEWLALFLARLVSIAFGWLLIGSVYGLMGAIWPGNRAAAVSAALFTAVTPQVIFISSIISNDVTAAATSGLMLFLLARQIRLGFTWQRCLAVGIVWGLALLSKSSTLVLALPLAAAILAGRTRPARGENWPKPIIIAFFWAGLGALIVAGWWYIRTWILYGSPLGTAVHCYASWAYCNQPDLRPDAWAQWQEVFDSYWAAFGWGNVKFPGWAYLLPLGLTLAAIFGWLFGARLQGKQEQTNSQIQASQLTPLLLTIVATAVALEAWMRQVTAPHGRLLFPALAAISCLLTMGWYRLWPPLRHLGAGTMLVFTLASLGLIFPAYNPPDPLNSSEVTALSPPINWQYGTLAELISVTPQQRSAAAGETLPIEVCWRTLSQSEVDYTILIQLIGPENQVVAGRRTYPGLGLNPTSAWPINQVFCDEIGVDVPSDLTQTLRYQVEIGLINQETGERLPVHDAQGNLVGAVFASAVRLHVDAPVEPPAATGSGPIQLASYETNPLWQQGQPIALTLRWWLDQPLAKDYTVFIHLRQPATNEQVLEADGPPRGGWYPTSWWVPPEQVIDKHTFTLPRTVAPGTYELFVGWYDPATGQRLGEEFYLTAVEVTP